LKVRDEEEIRGYREDLAEKGPRARSVNRQS